MSNRTTPGLTKGDFCRILVEEAKDYRKGFKKSLMRNAHMHDCSQASIGKADPDLIDAILVDYINSIAYHQGMDYGLYTKDLKDER